MANKRFWLGILVMALVFGMTVFGCGDCDCPTDDFTGDTALNGTWDPDNEDTEDRGWNLLKFDNGNFESFRRNNILIPMFKGTYTTSSGIMILISTHVHGSLIDLQNKWFSAIELKSTLQIADEEFNEEYGHMFASQTVSYSVNGNKLTLTIEGETMTYTRKN